MYTGKISGIKAEYFLGIRIPANTQTIQIFVSGLIDTEDKCDRIWENVHSSHI